MGGGEDLWPLHTQGGKVIDVEETAIVNFIRGDAPVRQAVGLVIEQAVQQVKAVWIVGLTVQEGNRLLDKFPYLGTFLGQDSKPSLDHFLFALPLRHLGRLP